MGSARFPLVFLCVTIVAACGGTVPQSDSAPSPIGSVEATEADIPLVD